MLPRTSAYFAAALAFMFAIFPSSTRAQTFTTLNSFDGTDGESPYAGLTQASDGNLYGATYGGGSNAAGTIFKSTPAGILTALHSFCSQPNCADGANPVTAPVQAADGNFYGAAYQAGTRNSGTLYKLTPSGSLTVLHTFAATDGSFPVGLIEGSDGKFYGTAEAGGANQSCDYFGLGGCGTVFSITSTGTFATLYNFCSQPGCADGAAPLAALLDVNGNFYGTTSEGGANGFGTVFELTPAGKLTTLHSFDYTDGNYPLASLLGGADGNLYGTTRQGGAYSYGTVFRITPGGTFTTLHSFDATDGSNPQAGLVQATDGKLYGTTNSGGANGVGTIFRITPGGDLTTLQNLTCAEGCFPYGSLLQETNGNLYGTTLEGGTTELGVIYSLSLGLQRFVLTQPAYGKIGARVRILGNDLVGTTSVTFHGTEAAFTVASNSEILATVPAGATTGKVQVTTSNQTLSSNVAFRVLP